MTCICQCGLLGWLLCGNFELKEAVDVVQLELGHCDAFYVMYTNVPLVNLMPLGLAVNPLQIYS